MHPNTEPRGTHMVALPVAPWPRGSVPVMPGVVQKGGIAMTNDQIKLEIIDCIDRELSRRQNRSVLKTTAVVIFILPLAYLGITCLASRSAEDAANEKLSSLENSVVIL
jgi:hypothetical protein